MVNLGLFTCLSSDTGFGLYRNGQAVKTPAGHDFIVPTAALGAAIAAEWNAQIDRIKPDTMPLTQLAATAIDIATPQHDAIVDHMIAYVNSELLCHYAEQPLALVERQRALWQPILDWCLLRFDAFLKVTTGIMPLVQSQQTHMALHRVLTEYDVFRLTGARQAAELSGSLLLGLALAERYRTAEEVFAAAEIDALFQAEKWGEDIDTVKRHLAIRRDLAQCEKWFSLLS